MYLVKPIVSYFHGSLENLFKLLGPFLFVAPLQVVFGECHRVVGRGFFIDSIE